MADTSASERKRVMRLASEYEAAGYDVIVEPSGSSLPTELGGYSPDIIARKGGEVVVIEVKTKANLKSPEIQTLARKISNIEGWTFELVVTNPKTTKPAKNLVAHDRQWVSRKIDEAKRISEQASKESAFLVLWAALESAVRRAAENKGAKIEGFSTLKLIKTAYSYGAINKATLTELRQYQKTRNRLVHGLQTDELPKDFLAHLSDIILNKIR